MAERHFECDVNRDLNGVTPLPINARLRFGFNNVVSGKAFTATQLIYPLSEVPPFIRRVVRRIERQSLSSPNMNFRESGALMFIYKDKTAEVRTFTSNLYNEIDGAVHHRAINSARILDELYQGLIPQGILHFHTHPGPEYRPPNDRDMTMLMNERDLSAYQSMGAFFSAVAGRQIPVIGIVRPVGKTCGDVLIEARMKPYDPDGEARRIGKACLDVIAQNYQTP